MDRKEKIRLHDREFRLYVDEATINAEVDRIAKEINEELKGEKPIFVSVLNGAFMFTSDLLKRITLDDTQLVFIRIASYDGVASTGDIKEVLGLNMKISDRTVVVVEDIVDTGKSLHYLNGMLKAYKPKQIKVAALFYKPDSIVEDISIDYAGIKLENDFVVGHGLDYNGLGRNLPDLYVVCD